MNMEHQQFYKMVQYDASARVPLVIRMPPGSTHAASVPFVTQPTSHVDLFPTIMDLAQVPAARRPDCLMGESLVPLLPAPTAAAGPGTWRAEAAAGPARRNFSVIQFHGCDIAMSWFSIVDGTHKYTVFGSGEQHPPQLFNLLTDPDENVNAAASSPSVVARLDALLKTVVDYPTVANDVANYNHASFSAWVNGNTNWKTTVANGRWKAPFNVDTNASIAAIQRYVDGPASIQKCRASPVWPATRP